MASINWSIYDENWLASFAATNLQRNWNLNAINTMKSLYNVCNKMTSFRLPLSLMMPPAGVNERLHVKLPFNFTHSIKCSTSNMKTGSAKKSDSFTKLSPWFANDSIHLIYSINYFIHRPRKKRHCFHDDVQFSCVFFSVHLLVVVVAFDQCKCVNNYCVQVFFLQKR